MPVLSWSCMSRSSMRIWSMSMPVIISTADLMELDTIGGILFGFVESYMSEIVPDREGDCTDNIGEEELVEHKEDPEWYDGILVCDHIAPYGRCTDCLLVVETISEPYEECPHLEYIGLFCHIDDDRC